MSADTYTIHFTARRVRWLPWPLRYGSASRVCTWEEVYAAAHRIAEMGAPDVVIEKPDGSAVTIRTKYDG